jgi:spermidine synthase
MLISHDQKVTARARATRRDAPCDPAFRGRVLPVLRGRVLLAGHVLALASGATALAYEVLWTRQFVSLLGATAPAISATLSAIFLGLAVGNEVVGRRCARWPRPLRTYGIMEVCIGLAALLVIPILGTYEHIFPVIYQRFSGHPSVFVVVKTCLAAAALFVPAFLMGGTLPLLAQAFVSPRRTLGEVGSGVYAANTFGATLGALSAPFYLLPTFGAERSYYLLAAVNLFIGATAIWLDGGLQKVSDEARPSPEVRTGREARPGRGDRAVVTLKAPPVMHGRVLVALAFLSGALVLALEVLWSRMLAQVHENSIYSFAVVLAVFLVGLAGGAALARSLMRRRANPLKLLGLAWVGAGVFVFGSPHLFYFLTGGLRYVNEFGPPASSVTLGLALSTMLVPTFLAGMILPLLLEITSAARREAAGALLGRLLAINTAGAIVGPLVAAYAVLPLLGLWVGVAVVGLSMVAAGELALRNLFGGGFAAARRAATLFALAALFAVANPFTLPRVRVKGDDAENLIHVREGSHGIVAVVENRDDRWMLLNNFYTLGGTASAAEERQQARIPILLHPAPRKVAFLGLGTGITAGGALLPEVEKVVALELVPEVVTTARDHFSEANLGLLDDGRVEVINEDARIYLKGGGKDFDVIVGDLVVPWRSGESALFTREHFEAARGALAPGGIYCQWLPLYQLSEEQLRIIAATFLDVFPRATLWRGDFFPDAPALALVGHTGPDGIDAAAAEQTARRLEPSCAQSTPLLCARGGLWLFLVGPLDPADPQFVTARRNRESEPWIELLSPHTRPDSDDPASSHFVGEKLHRFMERVRAHPPHDSPLKNMSPEQLKWGEAGAILWEASVLLNAGREGAANARAAEALALLPNELRGVIAGEAPQK